MNKPVQIPDSDYTRVAAVIDYLDAHALDQPRLSEIASHVGLSPSHLQRVFSRWAGISPKDFVQAVTHQHARSLLEGHESVLDAAHASGLSGPGRLHDLCLKVEALTPGEIKRGAEGVAVSYGFHGSPFGTCLICISPRGLMGLGFCDAGEEGALLNDYQARWPQAHFFEAPHNTARYVEQIFTSRKGDLSLHLFGTPFQLHVWQALLRIPEGRAVTYKDIATQVCSAKASRAVGSAVGRNPISLLIPCHRVLRQTGAMGGYHWGVTRKKAILAFENAPFT